MSVKTGNTTAGLLAETLDQATSKLLSQEKSPSPKVGQLDNRSSHFYLALYWAQALSEQIENQDLQKQFQSIAEQLKSNEAKILSELNAAQGKPVNLAGYYDPDETLANEAMRPSVPMNKILA